MKLERYGEDGEKIKERRLFTSIPIFDSDSELRKTVAFDSWATKLRSQTFPVTMHKIE